MTQTILARSPVRISFGGGGTDLEAYYARFGGLVVSAAIARHAYVAVRKPLDGHIHLSSADYRRWESYERGTLPSVRPPLALLKAAIHSVADRGVEQTGLDLFTASEIPPGTGLGSSSAMAAALSQALHAYLAKPLPPTILAEAACALEIEQLDMPIGKQDQYASVFGGINAIAFRCDSVTVTPLQLNPDTITALDTRLLLFSTGKSRNSAHILRQQRKDTSDKRAVTASLHRIKDLAQEMRVALEAEDLDGFGFLLHEAWQHKKQLSGRVSSEAIDRWYEAARAAGALGGKITGAGGGGFLLLYCPVERQSALRRAMAAQGLRELPFAFDFHGTQLHEVADDEPIRHPAQWLMAERPHHLRSAARCHAARQGGR